VTWPIRDLRTGLATLDFRGRIGEEDALRQHKTVQEILERLGNQPGVILADEVGMGKTFVALGAAVIAAQQDLGRNPVVVMIPPSLREKWPRDAEVFASLCLPPGSPKPRFARATRALHFLRMLDDPPGKRPQIIFLLHGAFHVKLIDPWIKLALIRRAMHNMKLGEKRTALPRFAASILRMKSRHDDPRLYELLLRKNYEDWKSVINAHYRDYPDLQVTDDPIPKGVIRVLDRLRTAAGPGFGLSQRTAGRGPSRAPGEHPGTLAPGPQGSSLPLATANSRRGASPQEPGDTSRLAVCRGIPARGRAAHRSIQRPV
jgi:hypothetical protein